MKTTENVIIDRRNNKLHGTLLLSLINNLKSIQESWDHFSKLKIKNQDFIEELSEILITVNYIKESCNNKGFIEISQQADELETALTELIESPKIGDKLLYQAITSKMYDLFNYVQDLYKEYQESENFGILKELEEHDLSFSHEFNKNNDIFIISNDSKLINECSTQMRHYGYVAQNFNESNFVNILGNDSTLPAAIIIDLDIYQHNEKNSIDLDFKDTNIPIIVVSSSPRFHSRLKAVQLGSMAFFAKPINTSSLLDKLDNIIHANIMSEPAKVLVIDDSKTISEFLNKTLTKAGMIVHVERTPEEGLNIIQSFNPDLILMDMYMPVCNGEDLCRIIRQYESFTTIPIVFLSSETDVQKQLEAMKIGADDFLTKGIDSAHLITSITTRIKRHRILNSFMIRDSLTGLLNHTASKKQLDSMLIKAQKLNVPVCFAMIDIDHFKKVNDTYGHPTGDKVIKSLSRLLQKRLRRTDSVGRYGGEEFAVVLWDTDAIHAKKIIDEIREHFSQIEHTYEDQTFFTTFSSGIAEFPQFKDTTSISNAADKALYVSKRGGRNQASIATNED
jgi:diguanylate cyclase (GGDEF)-like protein